MKLMKKSALSLTLGLTLFALLASCAPNNKKYRNIGCYSLNEIPPSTELQAKVSDECTENQTTFATTVFVPPLE